MTRMNHITRISCRLTIFLPLLICPVLAVGSTAAATEPVKGEYILVRNQDPVCASYTHNLNEFRHIDIDACHPRLSPRYPEFSRPKWREVQLDWSIAETFFNPILLNPDWKGTEQARISSRAAWNDWQAQARPLALQGKLRMWRTEIDVNHDGELDPVARIDRIHPSEPVMLPSVPLDQRNCADQHSGLHFLNKPKTQIYGVERHFSFGGATDLIQSSATRRTYTLEWLDITRHNAHEFTVPPGATRGVSVGFVVYSKDPQSTEVCFIAWQPVEGPVTTVSAQSGKAGR